MNRPIAWTSGLLLAVTLLAGVAASMRRGNAEPSRLRDRSAGTPPLPLEVPAVALLPSSDVSPAASPPPKASGSARVEGFREAKDAAGEGALSGQVLGPQGPLAG